MGALTAIVTALSIAVAGNFLVLFAVVRRLRLQPPAARPLGLPTVGMQAPAFSVQGADEQPIDERFYAEHHEAVVAFFADNCDPCEKAKTEIARKPIADPLLAFVKTHDGGPRQADFAATLERAGARAVLLDVESDIPARFAVGAFPTFLRLRDGIVVASSTKLADVRREVVKEHIGGSPRRRTHPAAR